MSSAKKFHGNGDMVSRALRKHRNDMLEFAEKLGAPHDLNERYADLNNGQKRMLVGIRLRSLFKKDATVKKLISQEARGIRH